MKSNRIFFICIILFSLGYVGTKFLPTPAHAIPKSAVFTGEYPDAVGARCSDVDYANKSTTIKVVDGSNMFADPNPNGPTLVNIELYVNEITEVDEGANSFRVQGFLDLIWCDPRLAFNADIQGTKVEIFLEDDAHEKLNNIWWPNLEFVNENEPVSVENLTLLVHPDGTVEYRSKISGQLASDFDLHAFPFDKQELFVEIQSFEWAGDTMEFLNQGNGVIGFSDEFRIPEWYVTGINEKVESKKEPRDHSEFSQLAATIHVQRDPGVYTTKVMIPLGVIILITMIIFWMDQNAFEDRLGASMTGLLTAVAYQFIASQNLPKHVYNTYLDSYVFLSFIIILFGIGESAIAKWLYDHEKPEQAAQLDRTSRWFMPLLYIAMIIVLYLIYTR